MHLQPAAGPEGGRPGARGRRREGPLFSPLKGGLRKAGSVIFPRSASGTREQEPLCSGLCPGRHSGHSLGLASAGDSPAGGGSVLLVDGWVLAGWPAHRTASASTPGRKRTRLCRGGSTRTRWVLPPSVLELRPCLFLSAFGDGHLWAFLVPSPSCSSRLPGS
jgi:hypothetical protein